MRFAKVSKGKQQSYPFTLTLTKFRLNLYKHTKLEKFCLKSKHLLNNISYNIGFISKPVQKQPPAPRKCPLEAFAGGIN